MLGKCMLSTRDALVGQCYSMLMRTIAGMHLEGKEGHRFKKALKMWNVLEPTEDVAHQRAAIRAALIAMPAPLCRAMDEDSLAMIDRMLADELAGQEVVEASQLPEVLPNVCVWQGDMSLLRCDAVVNPANNALLGCFLPTHRCLDNILHAQSGPRLRIACAELLESLGVTEDLNGQCRVTPAFSLPSKYVFHTVGPNLLTDPRGQPRAPTSADAQELESCYVSCLNTAQEMNLSSVAFCCISTGVFGYPQQDAARIALTTSLKWLAAHPCSLRVVFNVFKDEDLNIYIETASTLGQTSEVEDMD